MRVLFYLEDSTTFFYALPCWIEHLCPGYKHIDNIKNLSYSPKNREYVIKSGHGYPQMYQLKTRKGKSGYFRTLLEFIDNNPRIDLAIFFVDSDYVAVSDRFHHIQSTIAEYKETAPNQSMIDYRVIVVKKCFETWLLGNKAAYPDNVNDLNDETIHDFKKHHDHYNVRIDDPEEMNKPRDCMKSVAQYHTAYLKAMLKCPPLHIEYEKRGCVSGICRSDYVDQLVSRANDLAENHIKTFKGLLDCFEVMKE